MVKKKKETKTKKVKETKTKKPEVRSYVDYKVFTDNSAAIDCHCSDKELVALMLILYKRLDENARKVIDAVIRTLSLIDKV
ncbi:MAG: hypothetical protein J6T10_20095 [Methanobrevibacter sp.]|nr:hypothetical protein [Methanobrevibacter sp.]